MLNKFYKKTKNKNFNFSGLVLIRRVLATELVPLYKELMYIEIKLLS
jgi:hypothetical protein